MGAGLTPAEPLPLRVRSAGDFAQQLQYHRANALAHSLLTSRMVPVFSAPAMIPYGLQKADYRGSVEAERLEKAKQDAIEAKRAARNAPGFELQERYERQHEAAMTRAATLARSLDAIEPRASRTRPGVPGLYFVSVPAVSVSGYLEATHAPQSLTLDTRSLSGDLRERLWRWLGEGSDMLPWRYTADRQRYKARSGRTPEENGRLEDVRALLLSLQPYATRNFSASDPLPDSTSAPLEARSA